MHTCYTYPVRHQNSSVDRLDATHESTAGAVPRRTLMHPKQHSKIKPIFCDFPVRSARRRVARAFLSSCTLGLNMCMNDLENDSTNSEVDPPRLHPRILVVRRLISISNTV